MTIFFASLSLFSAIVAAITGLLVYGAARKSLNHYFMLLCTVIFLWGSSEFLLRLARNADSAEFLIRLIFIWPFASAFLFHFATIYTEARWGRSKIFFLLLYLPTSIIAVAYLTTDLFIETVVPQFWGWSYIPTNSPFSIASLLFGSGLGIASMVLCWRYLRRIKSSAEKDEVSKQQARLVLIGISMPVLAGTVTDVVITILNLNAPSAILPAFALGTCSLIGYAVWHYQLFTISPTLAADNVIATMPDALFLVNPQGQIVTANSSAERLLAYHSGELSRLSINRVLTPQAQQENLCPTDIPTRDLFDQESTFRDKNGGDIPVSLSRCSMKDKYDRLLGTIIIARDISERKMAEAVMKESRANLADAQRIAQVGNWDWNFASRQLKWSDETYRLLGYGPRQFEPSEEAFLRCIHPEDKVKVRKAFHGAIHNKKTYSFDHRLLLPDGSVRHVHQETKLTSFDSSGRARRMLGTIQDITERKEAEERIIRQRSVLSQRNAELSALYEISQSITGITEMNTLLARSLDAIIALVDFTESGLIMLLEGDELRLAAHAGNDFDAQFIDYHRHLQLGTCLCGQVAAEGGMLVSSDAELDQRHSIRWSGMTNHGHVIIPLKARGRTLGVLCLYTAAHYRVEEQTLQLLFTIGARLGIAIENIKLYEETRELAWHDSLTGLANRRLMYRELDRSVARAKRGMPLAVIMADLDDFKVYNDTYGHSYGDKCLATVAAIIAQEVREADLAARFGGEEFLIILPDAKIEEATQVAERIRRRIEAAEVGHQPGQPSSHITASFGVTAFASGNGSSDALVSEADAALYQAKRQGRNRVVSFRISQAA